MMTEKRVSTTQNDKKAPIGSLISVETIVQYTYQRGMRDLEEVRRTLGMAKAIQKFLRDENASEAIEDSITAYSLFVAGFMHGVHNERTRRKVAKEGVRHA